MKDLLFGKNKSAVYLTRDQMAKKVQELFQLINSLEKEIRDLRNENEEMRLQVLGLGDPCERLNLGGG